MMKETRISIRANKNEPYTVEGASRIKSSQGDIIPVDLYTNVCRCGKSRNKPFCDKTHIEYGFSSRKLEGRQPDRVDKYEGKHITIYDNRGVCSHRGHCTDNLPTVFKQGVEPWIDPDGADPKEIARVIRMCPSGTLSYEWNGTRYIQWEQNPLLRFHKNGPIEVEGSIELRDEEGSTPPTMDHYTLCRCGGSKNKPFCDGTLGITAFVTKRKSGTKLKG